MIWKLTQNAQLPHVYRWLPVPGWPKGRVVFKVFFWFTNTENELGPQEPLSIQVACYWRFLTWLVTHLSSWNKTKPFLGMDKLANSLHLLSVRNPIRDTIYMRVCTVIWLKKMFTPKFKAILQKCWAGKKVENENYCFSKFALSKSPGTSSWSFLFGYLFIYVTNKLEPILLFKLCPWTTKFVLNSSIVDYFNIYYIGLTSFI